jgi:predicted GNAT family acetyltransferase
MSYETADPDVVNDVERQRYEISSDGALAGCAFYTSAPGRVVFVHTEIDQAYEGQGLGSRLVKAALDDVRRHNNTVVPRCPFFAAYIRRHPDYLDLVEAAYRNLVGPPRD